MVRLPRAAPAVRTYHSARGTFSITGTGEIDVANPPSYPPIMRIAILLAIMALGCAQTAVGVSLPSPSTCVVAWK
jgi:hypothetical protein